MTNPLLQFDGLPAFSTISPAHIEPAVDTVLAQNRATLNQLTQQAPPYTWQNLMQPLEAMENQLDRVWSPVSHLNAVMNSDEIRAAYNACLPKLSTYATELGQNEALYQAMQSLANSDEYKCLNQAQRRIIDNTLRDFKLTGIGLPADQRQRFKDIQQRLAQLTATYEENLLDATNAWKKPITQPAELQGLPESTLAMLAQNAQREQLSGWLLSLDFPCYYGVITYADDRLLRQEIYTAYNTRASDQGPFANQWDNLPLMVEIIALRQAAAKLLGFANYAQRSLATKMAESTDAVLEFLHNLAQHSLPRAREELQALQAFAAQTDGIETLQAWDIPYYSEKLRLHNYAISQESLKPYFPESQVLNGMFSVAEKLYNLHIKEQDGIDCWHPDVRFFTIHDADGQLRGQFYLDLYARPKKRGGAWMADCQGRWRHGTALQIPVAYLTCNLSPPVGDDPALFTHTEVITLFHEFGHGLHHMLTLVDEFGVAGIRGVAWDAVELPSQFMENWCWEREALDLFAQHYQTGEPIPTALFAKMQAAKNFQSAMQMVRQLELALFDFRLHLASDAVNGEEIYALLHAVRQQVAVVHPPAFNRFANSFSHIFAGGYAAGYYSYKWAEVLSADAFSAFEENGIFDRATGQKFLTSILQAGGCQDPMQLFVAFRGRAPQIDALLRHSGLAA